MVSKKSMFPKKQRKNKIGCNTKIFTEKSSFLMEKILRMVINLSRMNKKNDQLMIFLLSFCDIIFLLCYFYNKTKLDHNILPMRKMDKTEISQIPLKSQKCGRIAELDSIIAHNTTISSCDRIISPTHEIFKSQFKNNRIFKDDKMIFKVPEMSEYYFTKLIISKPIEDPNERGSFFDLFGKQTENLHQSKRASQILFKTQREGLKSKQANKLFLITSISLAIFVLITSLLFYLK